MLKRAPHAIIIALRFTEFNMNNKAVILVGKPGAGKGTLASEMKREGYTVIVASDELKKAKKNPNNPHYDEIVNSLTTGVLVSDQVISDLVEAEYKSTIQKKPNSKIVFDGYPRTENQAKDILGFIDANNLKVIILDADDDLVVERLSNRIFCSSCGDLYNKKNKPPKTDGACDSCGGELTTRPDDNAETVRSRIKIYENQTKPLIDYLRDKVEMEIKKQ